MGVYSILHVKEQTALVPKMVNQMQMVIATTGVRVELRIIHSMDLLSEKELISQGKK